MRPKKRGGAGGLFVREARGLQVVRGVDLKGPKAAGMAGRVTGTQQWGGGGLVYRTKGRDWRGRSTWCSTSEQGGYLPPCMGSRASGWVSASP